jgi:hypothetical protein
MMKLSLPQNWWFFEFHPHLMYLFCKFLKKFTMCMTNLKVWVLCFPYFTDNFIAYDF